MRTLNVWSSPDRDTLERVAESATALRARHDPFVPGGLAQATVLRTKRRGQEKREEKPQDGVKLHRALQLIEPLSKVGESGPPPAAILRCSLRSRT